VKIKNVVLVTPETYAEHRLIQSFGQSGKKYSDVALETISEQGHVWDRYTYAFAPNDPFITTPIMELQDD
jgi:hypothetical protein